MSQVEVLGDSPDSTHNAPSPKQSSLPANNRVTPATVPLFASQRSLHHEPTDNCLWGKRGNNL
jgi:hypothetical protein